MYRTYFLIDEFNFYHSVVDLEKEKKIKAKWFNYKSLCEFYLKELEKRYGKCELNKIFYFTAPPPYLPWKPKEEYVNKIKRYYKYLTCLEDLGIEIIKGNFKQKDEKCPYCEREYKKPVEKKTDVNITIKIFGICYKKEADIIVLISGDTDLIPAIRKSKELFPYVKFVFVFPYKRSSREIYSKKDSLSFFLKPKYYSNYLLPNPYKLKTGKLIYKPETW